jgi:hypothetical protein
MKIADSLKWQGDFLSMKYIISEVEELFESSVLEM